MKDPETDQEWQEAVNGAKCCIAISAAQDYGLIYTDMRFNIERCEEILERGKALGFVPDEEAVEQMIAGGAS